MKKSISLISILLLSILCTLSYAAENIDNTGSVKGYVILQFTVTKEGKVKNPKVIKSVPTDIFDQAALEAAKKLRFKPPEEDGVAVASVIAYPMNFKMSATEFEAYKAANDGAKDVRNGEYEKALSDFSTAIRITPENGRYYDLRGQVYYELGNYQKALEDYNKAIEKEPGMVGAYFDRGGALLKLGKYRKAIDDYTRVIKFNKKYVQAYNVRAVSYNKLNDTKNMCLDLKKACELGDCRGFNYAKKAGKCTGEVTDVKVPD